jgi:hypothetical protein
MPGCPRVRRFALKELQIHYNFGTHFGKTFTHTSYAFKRKVTRLKKSPLLARDYDHKTSA